MNCFFFFSSRRRHTRFDCDWSSDVCSSDLSLTPGQALVGVVQQELASLMGADLGPEIGRASCRESVDLRGRRVYFKRIAAKPISPYNFPHRDCTEELLLMRLMLH